MRGKRRRHILN